MATSVLDAVCDGRLKLFDPEVNTNVLSSRSFKNKVSLAYGGRCLFCHRRENVTVAHLISHNNQQDYSVFNRPLYVFDFDVSSMRNRILLCGTKFDRATCHNLFDNHNITIFYDGFSRTHKAVVIKGDPFKPEWPTNHVIDLVFPEGFEDCNLPFKRVLAWRIRACALKYALELSPARLGELVNISEFSEDSEFVGNVVEAETSTSSSK